MSNKSFFKNRRNLVIGGAVVSSVAATPAMAQNWFYDLFGMGGEDDDGALYSEGPLPKLEIGDPEAPIRIVEYASMTCPHCASFHHFGWPHLEENYIKTGKVLFELREFPLDRLATAAAMLIRCSSTERAFATTNYLFQNQRAWSRSGEPLETLRQLMSAIGMSSEEFDTCLADRDLAEKILQTRQTGVDLGVSSTPSFFINGSLLAGAIGPQQIDTIIENNS